MAHTRTDMFVVPRATSASDDASRGALKLSDYLGVLSRTPDDDAVLAGLQKLVATADPGMLGEEPIRLVELARQRHEQRGEYGAVAALIDAEVTLVEGDPKLAQSLLKELGRVFADQLLDPASAREAFARANAIEEDAEVTEALQRLDQGAQSWREFSKRFVEEAESATDQSLKTSLLLRAAALVWQHRKKGRVKEFERLVRSVLKLDPGHTRAAQMLAMSLQQQQRWDDAAQLLVATTDEVRDSRERAGLLLRAARLYADRLEDKARAAASYERVLEFEPSNAEGMDFLAGYFAEGEQWDHLASLYEDALQVRQKLEVEQGLLLQVAMVYWKMLERPAAAEPYFARLRKLDAAHPAILEFYREFYAESGDHERLLDVLSDAQRVTEAPDEKRDLAVEVAQRAQALPSMTDRAIEAWRLVLRVDSTHSEALSVLKNLYAKTSKWNALVEVLRNEIDAVPDDEVERKVSLLRELGGVYSQYLRMDGMVINTYNAILKLIPGDRGTLEELADRYRAMGRWHDLITVLTQEADAQGDAPSRVSMYLEVARLWVEHFSNYNQASQALERVLELDPANREALSQLKEIYQKKRAWKSLYDVLDKEREVASDPTARTLCAAEMARLAAERLHLHDSAISLWKEVVAADPAHPGALEALERLAERNKDWQTLADSLEGQLSLHEDDIDTSLRILQKLGPLYADRLGNTEGAAKVFRRILEIDPRHGRAIRSLRDALVQARDWDGLEAQYAAVQEWEGLVDVLSTEAEKSESATDKVDLSMRAARVLCDVIGEPQRALRSYERALATDPEHTGAALALIPLYESEQKWSRLVGCLERLLSKEQDSAGKVELLAQLVDTCSKRLRDADRAFDYAAQAFAVAPHDPTVVAQLESAASGAGAFERLSEQYLQWADGVSDGEGVDVRKRVAAIAEAHLERPELALAQLQRVLKVRPEDAETLSAIERLVRAAGDIDGVRGVLQHRLEHGAPDADRYGTLGELARIEEEHVGDADAAAEHLRKMATLNPDDADVLAALDRLAEAGGRHEELADVLQRRVALELEEPGARAEWNLRLGQLYLGPLEDLPRAADALAAVLQDNQGHALAIESLEGLLERSDTASQHPAILETLEAAHAASNRYDKLASVLERRIALEHDEEALQQLRLRLAEISGSQLGDASKAYAALEAAFLQAPHDRDLWDRLAAAATEADLHHALAQTYARALESDEGQLEVPERIELSRRIARLYDDLLDMPDEAEPFHRLVLASDPLDDAAFPALTQLLTTQERWQDLQSLYRIRIEETTDSNARLALLLQIGFVNEEILEQREQAIETYQEVLDLFPDHTPSLRSLERLYEQTGRFRELVDLLSTDLEHTEGPDRVDLMFRLGQLHQHKLAEPETAADYYERVLQQQPTHLRTQEALASLLEEDALRPRVAGVLEPIYESQGAWRELCQVLELCLGDGDPGTQADTLLRIGQLQEQRLRDPEQAFATYARVVEESASERDAREALERVADGDPARMRRRAEVLERAAEAAEQDPPLRAELLSELSALLRGPLDDVDGAERAYERLLVAAADDVGLSLTASRALVAIQAEKGDHARLAQAVERQLDLEPDPAEQEALLRQLSDLYGDTLASPEQAISANQRRLELNDGDVDALRRLETLYADAERWGELCETLELRANLSDGEERRALSLQRARLLDERLDARARAIETYADVLTTFGPDAEVLARLSELYERDEAWPELLDTLAQREVLTDDVAAQAQLRFEMAEIHRERTAEPERAAELYEAALDASAEHTGALAGLDALMKADAPEVRAQAARVAAERYEGTGSYAKLLTVLEVLAGADEGQDRLDSLRRAAAVADSGLGESGQAFEYLGRAIEAGLDSPDLGEMLADYSRLAEASGRWKDYVALLRGRVDDIYDGQIQGEVLERIAVVAQRQLSDAALSREYYSKLLDVQPENRSALDQLERLTEDAGDFSALIEVLKRRAELSDDQAQRQALMRRQADIYERIDDPTSAIGVLEELSVEVQTPDVYEALERLYTATGKFEDLASCYEQQLGLSNVDTTDIRYRLARTYHESLGDSHRALDYLRDAVTDNLNHEPSIALLESLVGQQAEFRPVAAEILEPSYLARSEWGKLTGALEAQLEDEVDSDARKRLLVRLAQIHEDQLEDFSGTFEVYARLFREDPLDDDVWDTLVRLARVSEDWPHLSEVLATVVRERGVDEEQLARLARLTGEIYDTRVGNLEGAAEMYGMALAFEPTDEEAFRGLESAFERQENHEALLDLYASQVDVAADDERRVALLHRRAQLLGEAVGDRDGAIRELRAVLDIAPDDARAAAELDDALVAAADYPALADHLRTRIDKSLGTSEEVDFKLRLADLLREHLSDLPGALDVLEELVIANPRLGPAVERLETLVQQDPEKYRITQILEPVYRQLDQWKKRIAIYEAQARLLEDPADKAELLRQVAELHLGRGKDQARALHGYSRAMVLEPSEPEAREHVDRLAAELNAWDRHVEAYEAALAEADDTATKSSLLLTMARVHDEKRGDPRSAVKAYDAMLELDPDDPTPLDPLEGLHTLIGDWPALIRVLDRKAELTFDLAERCELLRRIAAVQEDLLADRGAAIETYRRCLEEDAADELALEALDRLYAAAGQGEPLAEVLSRRLEVAATAPERVGLGLRLAELLQRHLHQPDRAIEAYQRVMDDAPDNATAIAELSSLYQQRGLWPELLDVLRQQASLAADGAERAECYHRMGQLLQTELADPNEALDRYRDALSADAGHEPTIAALIALSANEEVRHDAEEVLHPLLRSAARWDELVRLEERAATQEEDPHERATHHRRLAEIHESGRGDLEAAFEANRAALQDAPADDAVQADVERLAEALGDWSRAYQAFAAQGEHASDPEDASRLFRRAAGIAESQLSDDWRAIEAFVKASERDDDASETLIDLDRLYLRNQRWERLVDVLERRVGVSHDATERAGLLLRLASLREERFDDMDGAFVAYREVLELDAGEERALAGIERLSGQSHLAREALQILEDCYRQAQDMRRVVGLYDVRLGLAETDAERAQLLVEAARLWDQELGEPAEAAKALSNAFALDPTDDGVLYDLERLARERGQTDALRALAGRIERHEDIAGPRDPELLLRAASWQREDLQDPEAEERLLRAFLEEDPQRGEVQGRLLELIRQSGREPDLVAALSAWARVETDPVTRADLLREAASVAETSLSDVDTAAECYEGVVAADENDLAAMDALVRIRAEQGRHADVVQWLGRRIDSTDLEDERLPLLYRQADVYETALTDEREAVTVYRRILQEAPDEAEAARRLAGLLEAAGRHPELKAVLETRLERADEPDERIAIRVQLAGLAQSQFGDLEGALAQLRQILDEEPRHAGALDRLGSLLGTAKRHGELADLLERRAALALEDGDGAAQVDSLTELGALRAFELGDVEAGRDAFQQALSIVQDEPRALAGLMRLAEQQGAHAEVASYGQRLLPHLEGRAYVDQVLALAHVAEAELGDASAAERLLIDGSRSQHEGAQEVSQALVAFYERSGNAERLAEVLSEAVERDLPDSDKVALLKRIAGIYREDLGMPERAVPYLEQASALVPSDREVLLALCDEYIAARREADAIPVLQQIIDSYGGRRAKEVAVYQHRLGRALERAERFDEAFTHYDAAFKIDLTNIEVLRDLGRISIERQDYDRAQKTYRALLLQRLGPDAGITKAEVYYHLGRIARQRGDLAKAKAMLQRAVSEAGDYPEASALLAEL